MGVSGCADVLLNSFLILHIHFPYLFLFQMFLLLEYLPVHHASLGKNRACRCVRTIKNMVI